MSPKFCPTAACLEKKKGTRERDFLLISTVSLSFASVDCCAAQGRCRLGTEAQYAGQAEIRSKAGGNVASGGDRFWEAIANDKAAREKAKAKKEEAKAKAAQAAADEAAAAAADADADAAAATEPAPAP